MLKISEMFGFGGSKDKPADELLPNIFPLGIARDFFIKTDTIHIFSKILTDVMERTHGLAEDLQPLLWDNCVMSDASDGLITLLAKSMTNKEDLFVVYQPEIKIIRRATSEEQTRIREDYATAGKSDVGVFISFKNYFKSDMVQIYSGFDFVTVSSLNKSLNVSNAIQLKIDALRTAVGLSDAEAAKEQALLIVKGLGLGRDVMLDSKDTLEMARPDLTPIKESIMLLNQRRSFYLGMPASYIMGEQTSGLNSTGEGDQKAVERGLKLYYFSVIKPAIEAIFSISTSYKSQDARQIEQGLEALKTFDLVSEDYISTENKLLVVNRLFDLDEDAEGDPPDPLQITENNPSAPFPPTQIGVRRAPEVRP